MLSLFKQYYPIRKAFFVLGEGLFIFLSVIISSWIILGSAFLGESHQLVFKTMLIALVCQLCLYYNELYDLNVTNTIHELLIRLLQALGVAAIVLAMVYFLFPPCIIGKNVFILSIIFIIAFIVLWRIGYAQILSRGLFDKKVVVIGDGDLAYNIIREVVNNKDSGLHVSAFVTSEENSNRIAHEKIHQIGMRGFKGIEKLAKQLNVEKIVVAVEERRNRFPAKELLQCRVNGIDVLEGTTFYEMLTGKLIVDKINPSWLIFSDGFQKSGSRKFFKRSVDLFMSLLLLIILAPILAIVAILIKFDSPGTVLYSQERVGENKKPYMVHKFRSMVNDAEKGCGPVWAQDEDPRITRVGKYIRKWRVDELPQIFNVIKGQMSFVGPRPERAFFVESLEKEIPYFGERFSVKPGITGWAQVNYPYGDSVEDARQKLNYDLFYIKNMTIFMDLMVIVRTVKTVLFGEGR